MKTIEEMKSFERARETYVPEKVNRQDERKMQWFRDAKFGMFIHWGLYSMLEKGEWVLFSESLDVREYEKLAGDFEAGKFDARAWAKAAKNAGMKYMVLTTRHHDGFCLFDSKCSRFNAMNSAAHRDFVKEYVEACREEGLKVGFYYSPLDWRFPGYFMPSLFWENALELKKQCHDQLMELMTNYGKIDLLWFDGEWLALGGMSWSPEQGWFRRQGWETSEYMKDNYFWESEKVINEIRSLQPDIMINNRFCWEGDFHVRERRIDDIRTDKPWDSNDCIADSWGYIPGRPVLSLRELVHNLIAIVVRDGNYLLNVGPTGDGDMEPEQVERLKQLGDWLQKYGKTVYGTRGGPVLPGSWGGTTYCGNRVYVHIIEWQQDTIKISVPDNKLVSWHPLNVCNAELTEDGDSMEIRVPIDSRDMLDTIIELEFEDKICWEGVCGEEKDIYGLGDGLSKAE